MDDTPQPPPSATPVYTSTPWVGQEGVRNAESGGNPPQKSNTDEDNMFGNDRVAKGPGLRRSFPAAPAWGGGGARLIHAASARATPGESGPAPAQRDGSAARTHRGGNALGENSVMMNGLAGGAGNDGDGGGVGRAQSSTGGGDARLRGLTSKLRHPLADVRGRAISNLSGKISLGLLSPSDILRAEPCFFSDVVALLSEGIVGLAPSGNRSPERGSSEGSSASAVLVLNLCVLLAKDPGCRARLAGEGAATPLSRMMTMAESSQTKGGGEFRLLAAEVLELVETTPGTRVAPESLEASGQGAGTATPPPVAVPERQQGLAWGGVGVPDGRQSPEQQHRQQHETEEACVLFGDGSEPRWPRWTKDFVDGPLLSADKKASSETVVACLCAGWRFPHVRLVRSEESALFDFEVRFRTASTPAGEPGLLRCLRHLRDEIVEDYPPEVLLQRPGSFGRLLSLLRTPSASERVIEEALSTASRLLERLVRSARLHQDASFLPPSSSLSDDQSPPAAGGDSDGYAFGGAPAGCVPGGGGAAGGSAVFGTRDGHDGGDEPTDANNGWPEFRRDEDHRHRRQRVLWEQQQQQQAGVPQDRRIHTTTTPGDAAVATLLSFRYPRSSPTVRFTAGGAASTASDGGLRGRRGATAAAAAGEVPEEDFGFGKAGQGGSEGLSVCGALFALFLSACPLLGYPAAGCTGIDTGGSTAAVSDGNAKATLASGGGRVSRGEEKEGRPASETSGVPSRVAVLAGEVLQAVIPYLLEPQGDDGDWGESTNSAAAAAGGVGGAAAWTITCPVDALRVQEVLCSTGQVLGDTAGGGTRDGGAPDPLVSIAVQLLLLLSPDDLVPGNDEQDAGGSVKLPPRLVVLLRDMVLDAGEAERRPSLRSRLWPLLARASPKEAGMLQAAQVLTRQAASVLNIGRQGAGAGAGSGPGMIEGCVGGAAANRGTSRDWSWVQGTLRQMKLALPLLRSVDDPRLVSIALALWFSAANAAFSSSSSGTSPVEAREAEGIGAAVVVNLVNGEFGERASAQAMHMLDELTTADDTVVTGRGCIQVPPSFAEAMARHGLADPRKRPLVATRLAAALAVVLGGGDGIARGGVGAVVSAVTLSAPSSPLFSTVLLRGTARICSSPDSAAAAAAAAASPAAAASSAAVSSAAASAARRVIASSCTALHGLLRSDGKAKNVSLSAAAAAAGAAHALSPSLEAFVEVCRAAEGTPASPATAAPSSRDGGAAASGYYCGHARLRAGQSEEDASSRREARHAVSSLLDFVDGLLEDETKQGLHPAAQDRFQAGGRVLSSPAPRRHRSPTITPSLLAKSAAARRVWVEVRGLCGGEANARAAASQRLASLLKEAAIPEDERGIKQGGVAPFPFLYLDDPLHRPPSATPIASTVANNGARGKPGETEGAPSEGQTLSFSAEHVRNLADVAGAPSLEGSLRRAAAEQLRGVLVSPGVAAVVLSETGDEDLCKRVLSAALSGLLPRPPPPSSPHPSRSDGDRSEDPWPSPPPPCPLPGFPSAAAASPGTVVAGGRNGRSGFGEHLWDEAFLGLLLAAVRQFAPVRRYLLAACSGCDRAGWSRTAEPELAVVTPSAGSPPPPGHLSPSRKGAAAAAAAVVAPNAVPAVLRRLYHPRPSVRRLAGSVAVRLAFDSPSFFSPLDCTLESPPCSGAGQDSDHAGDGGGRCRVGGVASLGEGFLVPKMVLEAFPRLVELTREGTSGGGVGSENRGSASTSRRDDKNSNSPSRRRHEAFQTLVASEWALLLLVLDTAHDGPAHHPGVAAATDSSCKSLSERHHRSAVAAQVAEALREAGRRADFEAAMLKARAWALAGFGYLEAFFGPDGGWETAFERFLRAPPNGTKDRAAMRDVTSLLVAGTDHMCPRGFQVLADAAEECFVPILSETNRRPNTVLGDYLGDWRAPSSSKGSARDLESKRGLRESILELLVAVVSSSRPGSDEAAVSLAASSLPAVIWGEFLGGSAVGVLGWSWWERGDAEDGGTPLTARRLAADFLTGLARRPRTGSAAVASWASLRVPPPDTDHDERGGGSQNLLAAAGWGGESSPPRHLSEPEPAPLLGMIVRSLVRHASTHRSPDGFRGRASLTASLVALETVLAAAPSPSSTPSPTSEGTSSAELKKTSPTSPVPVACLVDRGVPPTSSFGQGRRGEDGSNAGSGGAGDKNGLEWALRLACHRDATVRAVSFGVLAELAVVDRGLLVPVSSSAPRDAPMVTEGPEQGGESPTGNGGSSARAGQSAVVGWRTEEEEEEEEEEVVEACVRAALDGRYESPAVATEALRLLCRHTNARATSTRRLPAYSVPLAASLAKSAAPVLGGESGQNEAGSLSVAAASLRFVVVVVAAAVDISDAAARSKLPGTADRDNSPGEQRAPQGEPRRNGQHELQQLRQKLGRLLEVLWASDCLEACVHVSGEVWSSVQGSSGGFSRRDGWSSLLASSPSEAAMAYRNAQAAALALLRVVLSRPTVSTPRPTPAASTPPPLEETPGPLEQTAASAAERGCTPDLSATAAGSPATDHDDDGGGSAAVAASASGGSNRPSATAPAGSGGVDIWVVVRQALLQRTPLLAGLVRCLVAAAPTAALGGGGGTADRDSPCEGAVRVVQEACATLRGLLSCTDVAGVAGDDGGCSAISQAVFEALGVVLAQRPSEDGMKRDGGVSRRCGNGRSEAAKTEAKLLLAAMLATRAWRCSLDLACETASSLAAVLLEEEAVPLTLVTASVATRNAAFSAGSELRRRCLVPLLESSDALRALAVKSALIGDLSAALEALLGEIATVGHGRETLQDASRHLESLKAKHKKPAGGKKKTTATPSSPASPSSDARGGGERRGHAGKGSNRYAGRKPPIPTANAKLVTATSSKPSAATAPRTSSKPSTTTGQGRRSSSLSPPPPPSLPSSPPLKAARAPVQSVDGGSDPEREFYMVAALMASAIGGCPEGQAEALRLRLPQLLWKAWPMALASQLAHSSRASSSHRRHDHHSHRRGTLSVSASGRGGMMPDTPVLLQALLGLASCVARSCPEGKKAFIFAGPEGSSSLEAPGAEGGGGGGGEWPRSSRSLLHRIAALALSGSPSTVGGDGRADAGPYGRAATEAACDVVRSCALSHECRTVLSQSGFFADAFAQISRLCAKAAKTKPGTASFTSAARRIGDLTGVLVNSSLRAEGQKALMQVEGACDMLGDLVAVCLRATPAAPTAATITYSVLATRTLLLLRNLALAPSTGQIATHRESVVDLILRSTGRDGEGELTRAAASCLRAVLRGSSNDGSGKTAVGVGARGSELAAAVDRCLGVPEIAALSHLNGLMRREGADGDDAERQLRRELLAAKAMLV